MSSQTPGASLSRNEASLFRKIYRHNGLARQQLMRQQHLKSATFYNTVDALVQKGYVYTAPSARTGGLGRPTEALWVNPGKAYIFGAFLTVFEYRFALLDFCGGLLAQKRFEPQPGAFIDGFLRDCEASYQELLAAQGARDSQVCGVAVSATGPLDAASGDMLNDQWGRFAVCAELGARLHKPVAVASNANAIAWGLYLMDHPDGPDDLGFLLLNEGGIGVGTVLGGTLFYPARDPSPGLSHLLVGPGPMRCQCGHYGCLTTYVSPVYLCRQAAERIKLGQPTGLRFDEPGDVTFPQLCRGAEEGDELCVQLVRDAARAFCRGLHNYLTVLPVPLVGLGGTFVEHSPLFFDQVAQGMAGYAPALRVEKVTDYVRYAFRGISAKLVFELLGRA